LIPAKHNLDAVDEQRIVDQCFCLRDLGLIEVAPSPFRVHRQ
jgi:hypothetical protein